MKILVTLDGSHFSEAILGAVARIARPLQAEVELLAVGQPAEVHVTPARASYVEMAPAAADPQTHHLEHSAS